MNTLKKKLIDLYYDFRLVRGYFRRKREVALTDAKVVIVFILMDRACWNSLKSVYDAAKRNNMVDTYVVAVPPLSNLQDKRNYEFAKMFEENVIDAYGEGVWYDIKNLRPTFVFQQEPYDDLLPLLYRSAIISRYSKIVYVPYGFVVGKKHYDNAFSKYFMADVAYVYLESKEAYMYCDNLKNKYKWMANIKLFDVGFPRFDLTFEGRIQGKTGKTFTWIPRWTLDKNNNVSHFLDYYKVLIDYFCEHREYQLIIRPHPLMFDNFEKIGVLSKQEREEIFAAIDKLENVRFDNNADYLETFRETDVLIADFSTLILEFFITGKPIVYCGETEGFCDTVNEILTGMYIVKDKELLLKYIDNLAHNIEDKVEKQKKIIEGLSLSKNYNVGQKIVEICVKEAGV